MTMTNKVTKAVLSGRGVRDAVPAGDQVGAEGDPAAGRPPAHPVRDRRGARRRDQGVHLRHLARQERARGLFRQRPRARAEPSRRQQDHAPRPPQADRHAERHRRLRPPAGAPRPRPRGLVRAAPDRRRALRGHAARRRDRRRDPVPAADGRGLRRGPAATWSPPWRWRARTSPPTASSTSTPRPPRPDAGPRHGGEAEARGGAVEHGGDRPLHPDAAGPAQPRGRRGRRRRRDPADRRHRRRDRHAATTSPPSASRGAASTAARSPATCRPPSPSAWRGPTCATSSSTSCGPSPRSSPPSRRRSRRRADLGRTRGFRGYTSGPGTRRVPKP